MSLKDCECKGKNPNCRKCDGKGFYDSKQGMFTFPEGVIIKGVNRKKGDKKKGRKNKNSNFKKKEIKVKKNSSASQEMQSEAYSGVLDNFFNLLEIKEKKKIKSISQGYNQTKNKRDTRLITFSKNSGIPLYKLIDVLAHSGFKRKELNRASLLDDKMIIILKKKFRKLF